MNGVAMIRGILLALVTVSLAAVFGNRSTQQDRLTNDGTVSKLTANEGSKTMKITTAEFANLLRTIAEAWNQGDAKKAADCYTEDAIYTEPPDKQMYIGRKALYEFFGGDQKPAPPMKMTWHHLAFDEGKQIGFGEYTFEGNNRYHGIVIVKIRAGKISNWREYQYKSALEWEVFLGKNKF